MKINANQLIDDLIEMTRESINRAEDLKTFPFEQLNQKPDHDSWSVLECIAHLNLYGDFYLPEIRKRLTDNSTEAVTDFKRGWLGNYFAKSMLPGEKMKKMNTFTDKNPSGSNLGINVIDKFIDQQFTMLDLLKDARNVNLSKTKTAISISNFLKLRLGDTFRVVIYHNKRHMVQIENTLRKIGIKSPITSA